MESSCGAMHPNRYSYYDFCAVWSSWAWPGSHISRIGFFQPSLNFFTWKEEIYLLKRFFFQNNTAIISPYYPAAHDRYRIVWNRMFSYPYYSFSYIWISLAIIIALYYRIHIWFNNYLMYLLLYLLPFLFYFLFRTWYFWWHCRPYRQFSFFHYDHTVWLSFFVHLFCMMCMNKNITNGNCDAH